MSDKYDKENGRNHKHLMWLEGSMRVKEFRDQHGNRQINVGTDPHNYNIHHRDFIRIVKHFAAEMIKNGEI